MYIYVNWFGTTSIQIFPFLSWNTLYIDIEYCEPHTDVLCGFWDFMFLAMCYYIELILSIFFEWCFLFSFYILYAILLLSWRILYVTLEYELNYSWKWVIITSFFHNVYVFCFIIRLGIKSRCGIKRQYRTKYKTIYWIPFMMSLIFS